MTAPSSITRASADAPRARPSARWVRPQLPDEQAVANLAAELRLPIAICRLLCQRGYGDVEPAKRYLRPRLDQLHDPSLLLDLDRAVERLARAIRARELIMVHGDYDVDGMCSTALLLRAIKQFGGRAVPFIPRRLEDGYDLSMSGVNAAIAAGARVLITCDCGTNALEPVAAACAAGIDVIISDHHLPGGPLPKCVAVLNPKRPGCEYPDKDLAAVGVAFKIALALAKALGESEEPVLRMLDLVALATIADIAPLRGENRVMARYGLRRLAASPIPGLRALIRAAGIEGKPLTAGRVGFILAPRLNAVGRLGHALRGVELLMTEDDHEANSIARELEELNRRRQELDRATLRDASHMIDALDLDSTYGIVLGGQGWHPGVIGIVASRLVEEVCRPVVLVALDGETGKGSGRSISGFDLHGALTECADLLIRFGGHKAAAGVTVATERMQEFKERFNEVARSRLTPDDLVPEVRVDLDIALGEATPDLEALLRHFEPFGAGNATPVLAASGVRIAEPPRVLRNGHLKLRLAADGTQLDAIGWGMADIAPRLSTSTPLDVAFRLERDEWNGVSRLQARLADVRESI
ncbi:MAG TPA: single-stranded-DNA-specific exonuclease RecJ [Gemmatimonadaceae bacterium]|nr:single-stranded-DNA-specific exonuclease RecJ [Gemmatimonadaceae bacterium]